MPKSNTITFLKETNTFGPIKRHVKLGFRPRKWMPMTAQRVGFYDARSGVVYDKYNIAHNIVDGVATRNGVNYVFASPLPKNSITLSDGIQISIRLDGAGPMTYQEVKNVAMAKRIQVNPLLAGAPEEALFNQDDEKWILQRFKDDLREQGIGLSLWESVNYNCALDKLP